MDADDNVSFRFESHNIGHMIRPRYATEYQRIIITFLDCDGVLDLVIILDRSSGMRRGRYLNVVLFVSSILEQMEISGDKTRVGVISYADLAQIEFDLDQYTTKQEVMQHLERLDSTGGKANAAHALELMVSEPRIENNALLNV